MITWDLLPDTASAREWNTLLAGMPDYTVHQSFEWGEYKRQFGWCPLRVLGSDGGRPKSMIQLVQRRYPSLTILWGSGGPVGPSESWASSLRTFIRGRRNAPLVYCRLRPARPAAPGETAFLQSAGWNPSTHRFNSVTLRWDLTTDSGRLEQRLSRNWRHNLNRARKHALLVTPWDVPEVDEILRINQSMERLKKLPSQFSRAQLTHFLSIFGNSVRLLRCIDETGKTVALRGCVILGAKAWDMLAATAAEGRQSYSSYLLLWSLVEDCKTRGVEEYDLMGIDPVANPGVHNFKMGTGATRVECLGEWEWSNSALVKRAVNVAMMAGAAAP